MLRNTYFRSEKIKKQKKCLLNFYDQKCIFFLQAMLDYPYPTDFMAPLPGNPIKEACARADAAATMADGIREAAGLLYNGTDPTQYKQCFDIYDE